jgi:hypothetical protein
LYQGAIPERALGWAIIRRAIADAVGFYKIGSNDSAKIQTEALEWIFYSNGVIEPWSFLWWCELLDVEPTRVYRFMERYKGGTLGAYSTDHNIVVKGIFDDNVTYFHHSSPRKGKLYAA